MRKIDRIIFHISIFIVAIGFLISILTAGGKEKTIASKQQENTLNQVLTNDLSNVKELYGMDEGIRNYLRTWGIQGASLSIIRNDSLVYAKGYGWANKEKAILMEPGNILRVASVSKLITATGIMILQERGLLHLSDTVFGPHGILNDTSYNNVIRDKNYYKITVEHLLRHEAGFTRRYGDPMFSTRYIMLQNHLSQAPDQNTLLKCTLKHPLAYTPGASKYYSNFGYLLLSMIIEKVSGTDYQSFIQENVLQPAGCEDMQIAGNYYKNKYDNEVKYYVQSNEDAVYEYNNSGHLVERCYGGNDIPGLSGAGAWVASTPELARFVASIDGRPGIPDIISLKSVKAMTQWFDEKTYSLGWIDTKPTGEWTRTGTFSGTSALIKYYPDGECWILVTNTSTWKGPSQTRYTAALFNSSRAKYSALLPKKNLFNYCK
jgi:CubicO group peptidase (beta-lactamase class C family)